MALTNIGIISKFPLTHAQKQKIKRLHLELANKRGSQKTYCPSEVARKFDATNWRRHMETVRTIANELIAENRLEVLQKGLIIERKASEVVGPIRLRKK